MSQTSKFQAGARSRLFAFGLVCVLTAPQLAAQEDCTDPASVQRVELQIAEQQQQAKAAEKQQQAELKQLLDAEKQKKNWSNLQVEHLFSKMLEDAEFKQFEQQKKPHTASLIQLIRQLRAAKAGERDPAKECQQAQQITAILQQILAVNQQQYQWMRSFIQKTP